MYFVDFFDFLTFQSEFQTPHEFQPLSDWSDQFKIRFEILKTDHPDPAFHGIKHNESCLKIR
jgi:hypothetical protein